MVQSLQMQNPPQKPVLYFPNTHSKSLELLVFYLLEK